MELKELLKKAYELQGSDIFIVPGAHVTCKVKGTMVALTDDIVKPAGTDLLVREAYDRARRDLAKLDEEGDDDFSFSLMGLSRFRCNVYYQRGTKAATLRMVAFGLPDPRELGIPDLIMDLARFRNGMILVTGPAGSGKSTTLACIVDKINRERDGHIVTIEDPMEYIHSHQRSLVRARCATWRPSRPPSPRRRPAICCSPRCTPPARPRPWTAYWTPSRPSSRLRCACRFR